MDILNTLGSSSTATGACEDSAESEPRRASRQLPRDYVLMLALSGAEFT
jgi:hypothetical protein